MNKKIMLLYVSVLMISLWGCAVTDIDPTADFSRYRTFTWGESQVEVNNPKYKSDLIHRNIKAAIENEFARRGIMPVKKHADFVVSYHTYMEKRERNTGFSYTGSRFTYPYGFSAYGWRWGVPFYMPYMLPVGPSVETVVEGTLIIDVVDRRSDELVWRGMASGNVENIRNLEKQIEKAIKAIMKKYPIDPEHPLRSKEKAIS